MAQRMNQDAFLMNLPSHILLEILSWLPAKTIIHCRSVCKLWRCLVDDPHFATLHSSRARTGLVVHFSELFKKFFRIVDFDDRQDDHLPRNSMLKFNFGTVSTYPDSDIVVDGSVNGLLLLRDINYNHETLHVCNPLTREYVTLPRPRRIVRYPAVVTHGFGLASSCNEYKVVRVFQEHELHPRTHSCLRIPYSECQVYSLKTGSWRTIGEAPFCYDSRFLGLFFRGNIHWLVQDLEGHELISCFDLENEVFRPLPPPFRGKKVLGTLGILKERLCLCDNSSDSEVHIWVMKEYGVENSWRKKIAINKGPALGGPSFKFVHAFQVFRDGKILMIWGDFFMFYYCNKSGAIEEVDLEQPVSPNSIEAMPYTPSFQSLGSMIGLENVSNVSLF